MEQLTIKQRKEIYLKLAQSFEDGKQNTGLCYAFGSEFPDLDTYSTPYLLLLFPEMALVWASDVKPRQREKIDWREKIYWSEGFPDSDEEGQNIRAMLLYFAAAICE